MVKFTPVKHNNFHKQKIVQSKSPIIQDTPKTMKYQDFFKTANTGDILLFRNKNQNIGTWLTRRITNAKFDHIALVFRYNL